MRFVEQEFASISCFMHRQKKTTTKKSARAAKQPEQYAPEPMEEDYDRHEVVEQGDGNEFVIDANQLCLKNTLTSWAQYTFHKDWPYESEKTSEWIPLDLDHASVSQLPTPAPSENYVYQDRNKRKQVTRPNFLCRASGLYAIQLTANIRTSMAEHQKQGLNVDPQYMFSFRLRNVLTKQVIHVEDKLIPAFRDSWSTTFSVMKLLYRGDRWSPEIKFNYAALPAYFDGSLMISLLNSIDM